MTELEKREKIRVLVEELLTFEAIEERESQIFLKINNLSPDPCWSDYMYKTTDFNESDGCFNVNKFLDKIFNYKLNVIHL